MLDPKNRTIKISAADMDYISFGTGKKPFIMLPGLGDALRTVKGTALSFSMMYRDFSKDFRVYVFSRKNQLPAEYTIREMADDQAQAMKLLGISKAYVMGISQGGMIAMHLAADHPELVEKLVLANTVAGNNDTMTRVVGNWIQLIGSHSKRFTLWETPQTIHILTLLPNHKTGQIAPTKVVHSKKTVKSAIVCGRRSEASKYMDEQIVDWRHRLFRKV